MRVSMTSARELGERLEQEYGPRVARFGAAITLAATPTEVRMDVTAAGETRPLVSKWVQYARRLGWAGGDVEAYLDLADLEKELRGELDAWVGEREGAASQKP